MPRTAKESEAALTRLQHHSKESFGHLTKHALGYGAALVGGAGVVGGLEATVEASVAAEKSQAALQAQLKAVGISYKSHSKEIDDVVSKTSSYSGFLDKDLTGALANIVRSTGSLGKSYKLLGLATDVARAKNIDVASAGQLVGRVYAGNVRVLKSLGIQMDPVTRAQDKLKASTKNATAEQKRAAVAADKTATAHKALGLLQQRLGGQAKAFGDTTAGSMEKFKAAVDHLEVKLGNALAPTIKDVADKAAKFVSQMQTGTGAGGRFAHQMGEVAHKVGQVVGVAKDVAGWLAKHPALLKAAGAAWIAYKTAALVNIATVKAAELGLFGPAMRAKLVAEAGATGAASGRALGGAGALASARASGRLLGGAALAGVIYYLQQHSGDTRPIWDRILNPVGPGAGSNPHHLKPYTPPKGAPPFKPDKGPLRLQDTTPHGAPAPRAPHIRGHKTGLAAHASRAARAIGGGRKKHIVATASGEAGGQELASIQRAAAWVHANYPGVGTLIEDAGGGNQHLHIEGPYNTVVAIGHALQAAGFSVGEHPAFGGVHPVHSHGGLPGIPGDHYTGNAIDVNADFRSLSPPGGAPGGGDGTSSSPARATPIVHTKPKKPKPVKHKVRTKSRKSTRTTWERVSARLDAVDLAVSAGQLSEEDGTARKIAIIQNALPHLVGADAQHALAALNELTAVPEGDAPPSALDTVEGQIGDIGLHEHAGDYGSDPDAAHKTAVTNEIAAIDAALANPVGLSEHDILQLRAERGDLVTELNGLNSSVTDLAAQMKDLTDAINEQNKFAQSVSAVSLGTVWKALADVISGQIFGSTAGRAQTAGAGAVVRYRAIRPSDHEIKLRHREAVPEMWRVETT